MHRRILVIDTTDDKESIMIKALVNTRTHGQHMSNKASVDFVEFDLCRDHDCTYLFIHAVILNSVALDKMVPHSSTLIRKRLNDYFIDGIYLILFITPCNTLNMIAYENLRFIDEILFKGKVPVIFVVNCCDNTMMYEHTKIYQHVAVDLKSERNRIESIQRLWRSIVNGLLTSSIEQDHADHRNKSFDTISNGQSTSNSGKASKLSSPIQKQPSINNYSAFHRSSIPVEIFEFFLCVCNGS